MPCFRIFNIWFKSVNIGSKIIIFLIAILCVGNLSSNYMQAQVYPASPANWLFPDGDSEGTRYVAKRSAFQSIDSMIVKWFTSAISGPAIPLIGNIINNPKLETNFVYGPNEIVAINNDELVIVDGAGRVKKMTDLPDFVNSVSVLFDTLSASLIDEVTNPVIMGLETIEVAYSEDSLAFAYIAGFDADNDQTILLKRLAIDLRLYKPNIFASIKPVWGRKNGTNTSIYTVVNMSKPTSPSGNTPVNPPFFRGFTQFDASIDLPTYPLPDIGDDFDYRVTLGPEVNYSQPSISRVNAAMDAILLPSYPTPSLDVTLDNPLTFPTNSSIPYMASFNISSSNIAIDIEASTLANITGGTRPLMRPYYLHLNNGVDADSIYILMVEEYRGIDGSAGTSRLHLFDKFGIAITFPNDPIDPPHVGSMDHFWEVATGNVDGDATNSWLPYFPNNAGKEIILTKSSREFSVAASELWVMKYYKGPEVEKPSPPGQFLYAFDTVCTQRINGWVAAVNDLDGNPNKKDEIILVDGSTLMILRMRDYGDTRFRTGNPFDTVYVKKFPNQTISSVAVSDLEGDGYNDVIVTTHEGTYVLGVINTNTLDILEPDSSATTAPFLSYCAGDTVAVTWWNKMRGQDRVDIFFREVIDSIPSGELVPIFQAIDNSSDTVSIVYLVDSLVLGKDGYFAVLGSYNPGIINDITATFSFNNPTITVDALAARQYRAGHAMEFTGEVSCVDSISLEFSIDSVNWTLLVTDSADVSGAFSIAAEMPCVNIFNCDTVDTDSLVLIRFRIFRSAFVETSDIIPVVALPAIFPLEFDTLSTADPTRFFRWDSTLIDFACDTVAILVSSDNGITFDYITSVPAGEGNFIWQVPLGLPDDVVMRFCCNNSCVRVDTILNQIQPAYINIVAPNPFNPIMEQLEIVYKVPDETNVTIRIYDENNRIVSEPVRNAGRSPGIAYTDHWDGRNRIGAYSANGLYYIGLIFSNGNREIYPVYIRK